MSTEAVAPVREKVDFMTVAQFKAAVGAETISVLRNPQTSKLFMATNTGQNYKVQQDIDVKKEMRVLVPENGNLEEACLTNVDTANMAENIATL